MSIEQEKVLIVDDEVVTRRLLENAALTASLNLTVRSCHDAESAWELFLNEEPRLVVVDWVLPGMSGVELCRKMRSSKIGQYITILMVTSNDQPEDMEKGLEAGANFYMVKPVQRKFFQAWLSSATKKVQELRGFEQSDGKIKNIKIELEDVNQQLEAAISRANTLTMEAEKAYLEINQIFKTVTGGILVIDNDYNILKHNDNFLDMLEDPIDGAINKKCYDIFPSSLCDTPDCPLQQANRHQGKYIANYINTKTLHDGSTVHYSTISTPLRSLVNENIGIVEHITDITQQVVAEEALKESEKKYKELSMTDELTGLFNKRHFNQTLQIEVHRTARYGQPLSLAMMDIDNFKIHNDTYGHAEGDKVLAKLGIIINDGLRQNDIACRYGGEEFVVILPATDGKGALVVAERIRTAFAATVFCDNTVHKTLSIGVTQYTAGDNKEILVKRADDHLYYAKGHGKNQSILEY